VRVAEPIAKPTSKVGFAIFILIRVANRMGPERVATMMLHLIQILFAQTKVMQDRCQSSLRDIFASVVINGGISIPLATPPDFMPALCLSPELASQSPQLLGKFPIGHGAPTVRRSSP